RGLVSHKREGDWKKDFRFKWKRFLFFSQPSWAKSNWMETGGKLSTRRKGNAAKSRIHRRVDERDAFDYRRAQRKSIGRVFKIRLPKFSLYKGKRIERS